MQNSGLDWATFWITLVGSVATVAALVVAICLGVHEVRAFRRESEVREVERRKEGVRLLRAQAECVSARLHVEREPANKYSLGTGRGAPPAEHFAYAEVFNASALPIYDVEVLVTHPDHPGMVSGNELNFVPGGQTGHVHTPNQPDAALDGAPVGFRFRDAGGRSWHRHSDGHLHELLEGEPDDDSAQDRPSGS